MLCIYHILFIHSSVDGHLGYFHILTVVNNSQNAVHIGTLVDKYVQVLLSVLLGIFTEMELLGHMFNFEELPYCLPL